MDGSVVSASGEKAQVSWTGQTFSADFVSRANVNNGLNCKNWVHPVNALLTPHCFMAFNRCLPSNWHCFFNFIIFLFSSCFENFGLLRVCVCVHAKAAWRQGGLDVGMALYSLPALSHERQFFFLSAVLRFCLVSLLSEKARRALWNAPNFVHLCLDEVVYLNPSACESDHCPEQ